MFMILYEEQERGRNWLMRLRLKPFSVGKFVVNGCDFWKCGQFVCVVPVCAVNGNPLYYITMRSMCGFQFPQYEATRMNVTFIRN